MAEEEWRDIDGFDDYQVSNMGKVQNVTTGVYLKNSGRGQQPRRVTLHIGLLEKYTKMVARLVAEAFLEDYSEEYEVHYKSSSREDCSVNNIFMSKHKVRGGSRR